MGLFSRSKVTAGLDIGSGYVKLVVIDHSKDEPEITRVETSPLVPDAIVDGEIMDPAIVSDTIKAVTHEAGLKRATVVASVGGHDVIIKNIEMERTDEADARLLIRWEAEQHVPFDMEGVQLDFQILDPEADSERMSVLLVAAKRDTVRNKLELLSDAGLTASIVDVDAFALHNAIEQSHPDALQDFVALANIGNETTNVNLMRDGAPVSVSDTPFGTRNLREALQRQRGLSADEADEVIQGRGEAIDFRSFLAERVEELAVGIERSAAFVTASASSHAINRLYLSGGGARMPGIVEALAARLSVPTEIANPLQNVAVHSEVMQSVNIDELAPMLMLPVGLALRQ